MGLFGTRKTKRRIKDDGSVIVLDRVSKSYSTGAPALNGVNLRVKKGEFVFIVGDSGSGKSTLIKLLLRELTPTSGTILVNGQSVADLKPRQIPRYRRNLGINYVAGYIRSHKRMNFRELLENQKSRMDVIVTFLVVLELMKTGVVSVEQESIEDDIIITTREIPEDGLEFHGLTSLGDVVGENEDIDREENQ